MLHRNITYRLMNTDEPTATPPDAPTPTQPDTSQGDNEGASEPTFTQAELDKIVGERAKRAKESTQSQILEQLGVDSLDSIKALLDEAKKRKEAEMSEVEKALATADKERAEKEAAKQQLADLQAQIIANKRENAFKDAIRKSGGSSEDDLYILVQAKMKDELSGAFDDNGVADDKQLEALVKQVQSAYGNYFATSGAGSPSVSGGQVPTSITEATKAAEKDIQKKFGRL